MYAILVGFGLGCYTWESILIYFSFMLVLFRPCPQIYLRQGPHPHWAYSNCTSESHCCSSLTQKSLGFITLSLHCASEIISDSEVQCKLSMVGLGLLPNRGMALIQKRSHYKLSENESLDATSQFWYAFRHMSNGQKTKLKMNDNLGWDMTCSNLLCNIFTHSEVFRVGMGIGWGMMSCLLVLWNNIFWTQWLVCFYSN